MTLIKIIKIVIINEQFDNPIRGIMKENITNKNKRTLTRNMLPTLPIGMRGTGVENLLILDFISFYDNEERSEKDVSFASIVIEPKMAARLAVACLQYLNDRKEKNSNIDGEYEKIRKLILNLSDNK